MYLERSGSGVVDKVVDKVGYGACTSVVFTVERDRLDGSAGGVVQISIHLCLLPENQNVLVVGRRNALEHNLTHMV